MAVMTHREALDRLRANTKNLTDHVIDWKTWDREVERILDLRFPNATAPHTVQAGAPAGPSRATRTSSMRDTRRPAMPHTPASPTARAAAPDVP